jgi:hypothetical protein
MDELAKLGSSWAMVPTRIFLQELHESSNSRILAKASKVAKSSQKTPPPNESISESCEVMEIHLDYQTPFMIYLRTGSLPEHKVKRERLLCQA